MFIEVQLKLIQWNLCNPTPGFSNNLWHPIKIYCPKVFLLIKSKIKPECSDTFPLPLVCRIKQVPLYICIFDAKFHRDSSLLTKLIRSHYMKHDLGLITQPTISFQSCSTVLWYVLFCSHTVNNLLTDIVKHKNGK